MNRELALAMKSKIIDLPFTDIVGGLVQVVTYKQGDGEKSYTKKFPMSYEVYDKTAPTVNCYAGNERQLMPNSRRKSIIYFEDLGIQTNAKSPRTTQVRSGIRLVCWLDRKKLVGDRYAEISTACEQRIIDRFINRNPWNNGNLTRILITLRGMPIQDASIFSKYSYDETVRQFLMPPFEAFAIDFNATFVVPNNCLMMPDFTNSDPC